MKKSLTAQKQELLNFIRWKNKHLSSEEYAKYEKENNLKHKSYANLREWAIRNDIID